MIQHILVAVDRSIKAKKALEFALEEFPNADISTVYVISAYSVEDVGEEILNVEQQDAEEILRDVADIAAEYDRAIDTEIRNGRPADEIIEYATESGSDLIVMGSHGRTGLSRILMGSVTENVARQSPLPVTIV
jgi:nucleotide-binding universal stress UspA family protein